MRAPRLTAQSLAEQLDSIETEIHEAVTARPSSSPTSARSIPGGIWTGNRPEHLVGSGIAVG